MVCLAFVVLRQAPRSNNWVNLRPRCQFAAGTKKRRKHLGEEIGLEAHL
jgi:hypothetical protein